MSCRIVQNGCHSSGSQAAVGEPDWTTHSPDLILHLFRWIGTPTTLVSEWEEIPAAQFQTLVESLLRRSGGCYSS